MEALHAKWEHVDLDKAVWFLPQTKSGKGRHLQLNSEAQAILKNLALETNCRTWIFPGRDLGKPLNNPRKAFDRILQAAGLEHMRLHDLRHLAALVMIHSSGLATICVNSLRLSCSSSFLITTTKRRL